MNKLPIEMIDALFSTMTTLDKANFCRINKDFYGYCKQRNYIAPSWKVLKKNLKWVEKPGKVFGNNGRWVKFNLLKMDPSWKKSRKRVALLRHVPEEGIKFYYDADGNVFQYQHFTGLKYHAKQALDSKRFGEKNDFEPLLYKPLPTAAFGKMFKKIYAKKYAQNQKLMAKAHY